MMVTKKINPLLLTVVAIFFSAFSVVLVPEIDRAIAWIASSSWKHNHNRGGRAFLLSRGQKSKSTSVIFGAIKRDEKPTEDDTALLKDDGTIGRRLHPSQQRRQEQQFASNESVDMEESLFSQHTDLESYLVKTNIENRSKKQTLESPSQISTEKVHSGEKIKRKYDDDASSSTRSIPYFLQSKDRNEEFGMKPGVNESKGAYNRNDASVPYFLRPKDSSNLDPTISKDISSSTTTATKSTPYFLRSLPHSMRPVSRTTTKSKIIEKSTVEKSDQEDTLADALKENQDKQDTRQVTSVGISESASIDQLIYAFNKNLVGVLYTAISSFYPTSSSSEEQQDLRLIFSPLLGTEYNEEVAPKMILRFEKFYIFETVARIPYFAYLSVFHLRESLGDRGFPPGSKNEGIELDQDEYQQQQREKRIETMRTHYAQADNELHHLLIMEALGGNSRRIDRFVAHSLAFCYYWFVVLVFLWNEQAAYHLNEVVEDHAYKIYDEFLNLHEDELRTLPVPEVARKYYETDYLKNPHLFKAFCAVSKSPEGGDNDPRKENRPHELNSLYDVFWNVRDDEKEHWMALCNLVQYDDLGAVEEFKVKSTKGN